MKEIYKSGDTKEFKVIVEPKDTASFDSGTVHPIYSTFALGRDAEWCCRLFVLDMKEDDEEGIGTFLSIEHKAPTLIGSTVHFTATVLNMKGNDLICTWEAVVNGSVIAKGAQGQKIMKKDQLEEIFKLIS